MSVHTHAGDGSLVGLACHFGSRILDPRGWPKEKIRADAPAALGFHAGKNGYDDDSSVLASLRLENAVD